MNTEFIEKHFKEVELQISNQTSPPSDRRVHGNSVRIIASLQTEVEMIRRLLNKETNNV